MTYIMTNELNSCFQSAGVQPGGTAVCSGH